MVDADIQVYYNSDFETSYTGKTEKGLFSIPLKDFGWYIISVTAQGYLQLEDTVWVRNAKRKVVQRNIYLDPISIGLTLTMENVYFKFGTTSIMRESLASLDREAEFMIKNTQVLFEIAGHTDSDGDEVYNLMLSQGRAESVVNYLVSRGVDRSRLIAHGYGEYQPVDKSGTADSKAKNRRVDLRVLEVRPIDTVGNP